MENSADPDQTAPVEQSDQGLHCLQRNFCPNIKGHLWYGDRVTVEVVGGPQGFHSCPLSGWGSKGICSKGQQFIGNQYNKVCF